MKGAKKTVHYTALNECCEWCCDCACSAWSARSCLFTGSVLPAAENSFAAPLFLPKAKIQRHFPKWKIRWQSMHWQVNVFIHI